MEKENGQFYNYNAETALNNSKQSHDYKAKIAFLRP